MDNAEGVAPGMAGARTGSPTGGGWRRPLKAMGGRQLIDAVVALAAATDRP